MTFYKNILYNNSENVMIIVHEQILNINNFDKLFLKCEISDEKSAFNSGEWWKLVNLS